MEATHTPDGGFKPLENHVIRINITDKGKSTSMINKTVLLYETKRSHLIILVTKIFWLLEG